MDLKQWISDMEKHLISLKRLDLGYPQGNNILLPPDNYQLLNELIELTQLDLPEEFISFYQVCGGVTLPNIWNGYFIFTLKQMIANLHTGTFPTKIGGTLQGQILIFGADGGGNCFAIHFTEKPIILYLPLAQIQNDTIVYSRSRPKILSDDFSGFLLRLLGDTQAFVRHDLKWNYMDKHLYQS